VSLATTTDRRHHASRGIKQSAARAGSRHEAHVESKARIRARIEEAVTRCCEALHPDGPVPPTTAGLRLWKTLAGELDVTEQQVTTVARVLGRWPWTAAQVLAAVRDGVSP
jgi:hypothetical protein